MALEDNVLFFHDGEQEQMAYPTTGWATPFSPGSLTIPDFTGGNIVTDGSEARSYERGDASDLINIATSGAFSIAFRVNCDVGEGLASEVLFEVGPTGNPIGAYLRNTTQLSLWRTAPASAQVRLANGSITMGTAATFVFRRAGGGSDWVVYKDGSEITPDNETMGNTAMQGATLTIGSRDDGTAPIAQSLDWICAWDRALDTTEMANNMNETDIATALGLGGGGGGPPAGGMTLLGVGA